MTLHITSTQPFQSLFSMMDEMATGRTGIYTLVSREPEKWKENADSADVLQVDYLESDPFF